MARFPIEIDSDENADLRAFLDDAIYRFNVDATGISDGELLHATARDAEGEIVGGLSGHTWGGCCEITLLWITERLRGQGLGTALMNAAEQEAVCRGCEQIVLSTHSFQAPDFYERLGFRELASIPHFPKGHANIIYVKQLRKP